MLAGEQKAAAAENASAGENAEQPAIVFFDGVCGLCNQSVDFIIRRDRRRRFHFAPLQGETAQQTLGVQPGEQDFSTMVLRDAQGTWRKSSAASRILRGLGGGWALCGWLLWCVPRPIRDWAYGVVARNRYRWFGKKESCRMPAPGERELFLP